MTQEPVLNSRDPDVARAELERTRARMSETIDEIEDVLVRKRDTLLERVDVGARIRDKPMRTAGIVVAVGFLAGFLTGGRKAPPRLDDDERAALWEARARRLLRIAREQEGDIEALESALEEVGDQAEFEEGWDYDSDDDSGDRELKARFAEVREIAAERISEFATLAAARVMDGIRRRL